MIQYKEETINNALMLLNNLEVKGIENAKRVAFIAELLRKGEEDGGSKEAEEHI